MIQNSALPSHIAIIPDGNRRWAKAHKLPAIEGQRRGAEVAIKIDRHVRSLDIHTLTFWALSTENVSRSKKEVDFLMKLGEFSLDKYAEELIREGVRFIHLGRRDRIAEKLLKKIEDLEKKTKQNTRHFLNLALDYGGRDEVIRAIKKIQSSLRKISGQAEFRIQNLSEDNFNQFLDTRNQPYSYPDLIIRTGGEIRTSGFMIWQAAYSEYVFLDKYFPDVNEVDIDMAIEEYSRRQRRFGK